MDKRKIPIIKVIVFLVLFLIIFVYVQNIVTPKWTYTDWQEGDTARYRKFYEVERDSLDYIVLGPSRSFWSLNPMVIYAETGYTGYSLGGSVQGIEVSYYWLKEALKYQKPKYVILETGAFFYPKTYANGENVAAVSKALTNMRFSANKIEACFKCQSNSKSAIEYLIPLLSFHTRWEELEEGDFEEKTEPSFKGGHICFLKTNYSSKDCRNDGKVSRYKVGNEENNVTYRTISDANKECFENIYYLCKMNHITLIPIIGGTQNLTSQDKATLEQYLKEFELELLDLNNYAAINWNKDTPDSGAHVNYWGNCKCSKVLAQHLEGWDELENHSEDVKYQEWNTDLIEYRTFEEEKLINNKEQVLLYLNTLIKSKEELYIVVSVRDEACGGWNDELDYYIRELGLTSDFRSNHQNSFIAVIDGGNCIFEQWEENKMVLEDNISLGGKNRYLSVTSAGFAYGDTAVIKLDSTNYSYNSRGLNIVTIEKATGKVVSSVVIDTYLSDATIKVKELDNNAAKRWKEYEKQAQQILDGEYVLIPSGKEQCALDIEAGSVQENANLQLWTRTEELPQQFALEYAGNGLYYIKALCSDKYLTAYNYGNSNGTNVVQNSFTGLANQKWFIYECGDGLYKIMSHYNKLVLDVSGTVAEPGINIQLYDENGGEWQKFVFSRFKEE
ncbi:MAG: RICIN domain-containing protein [Lachnospiraceae bacterium]|nr:RICIN domain-containing protein [Lachnospiraceae bacterium]